MMDARIDELTRHAAVVRRVARAVLRNADRAADVEQETWLTALRRSDGQAETGTGWFAAVARTLALRERRAAERRERRERVAAVGEAAPTSAARDEAFRLVSASVLALGSKHREVILLRYYEGLPPRRIAARLGIPVATVKKRQQRALDELRGKLAGELGDDWRASVVALCGGGSWWMRVWTAVTAGASGEAVLASALACALAIGALFTLTASNPGTNAPTRLGGPPDDAAADGLAGGPRPKPQEKPSAVPWPPRQPGRVVVRVADGITGAPITNFAVILHHARKARDGDWLPREFGAHANGQVILDDVEITRSAHLYVIQAPERYCDSRCVEIEIDPLSGARVEVPLYPRRALDVTVVDDVGAPVAGSDVSLLEGRTGENPRWGAIAADSLIELARMKRKHVVRRWSHGKTDAEGHVTLEGPIGSSDLRLSCSGDHLRLTVPGPKPDRRSATVRVERGGSLRIETLSEQLLRRLRRGPATIELVAPATDRVAYAEGRNPPLTDGRVVTLTGVRPGVYDVHVRTPLLQDRLDEMRSPPFVGRSERLGTVTIKARETATLTIKDDARFAWRRLRALVTIDGKPAGPGMTLAIQSEDRSRPSIQVSHPDGKIDLDLPAGRYLLRAVANRLEGIQRTRTEFLHWGDPSTAIAGWIEVIGDDAERSIALRRTPLEIRLSDETGRPARHAVVWIGSPFLQYVWPAHADAEGVVRVNAIAPEMEVWASKRPVAKARSMPGRYRQPMSIRTVSDSRSPWKRVHLFSPSPGDRDSVVVTLK